MPCIQYQAIDPMAEKRKGLIEAQSEKDAKEKLARARCYGHTLQSKPEASAEKI